MEVVKIPNWDYAVPLSVHVLINSKCNLHCKKCFYKGEGELDFGAVGLLLTEWRKAGVRSIAIGGGEPLLHKKVRDIVFSAKFLGFYVAITTNGTVRKRVWADRVHVSFDEIHGTSFEQALQAIKFFKQFVPKVGVNHIVTNLKHLRKALMLPADTFTLLMEKPKSEFDEWKLAFALVPREKLWIDACVAQKLGMRRCPQGRTSMSIDQNLRASKCSNTGEKVPYEGLENTWQKVRKQSCPFFYWVNEHWRFSSKPIGTLR